MFANISCEDEITLVKCAFKHKSGDIIETIQLNYQNDQYENSWTAPSDIESQMQIWIDITAIDIEGDSSKIQNVISFSVYKPIVLLDKIYQGESYKVFDDSSIAEVHITIPKDSLDKLFAPGNEGSYKYIHADFSFKNGKISDTKIPNIGLRLRGAIPRYCQKRDFKISFNEFYPGRNFYGLTKFNLRALNRDPSIIREKICLHLLAEIDAPASRCSYVKLYINNEYRGLYLNVEEIDRGFLNAHFRNDDGNLYKCARQANLAIRDDNNYKFTFGPPSYAPHQIVRAYKLSTNETEDDYSDLINFIQILNNTSDSEFKQEIEKVFNVQNFLKAQAVSLLVGDWDGYWLNQNNYYLYFNTWTGKFEFIARDLDLTLGVDWGGGENATQDIYYYGQRNDQRPLMHRILNVPEYRGAYSTYIKQLIEGAFSLKQLWTEVLNTKDMIQSAVEEDNYRTLDYGWDINDFNRSYTESLGTFHAIDFLAQMDLVTRIPYGLKEFIETRISTAIVYLDVSQAPPIISEVTHTPQFPNSSESVKITTSVNATSTVQSVQLNYNTGNGFQQLEMYDDGQHNDDEANDQIYGISLPPFAEAKKVIYYITAYGSTSNELSKAPTDAPSVTYQYAIDYQKPLLFINEIMADNETTIADESGEYEDWIELYNAGNELIELGGMYLTDNLLNIKKWQMPDIYIAPGDYILLWADEDQEQGLLHTNFKLSRSGEQMGLFDTDENANMPIDIFTFVSQNDDESYGRLPDGNTEWQIFKQSTPGKSNSENLTEIYDNAKSRNNISNFNLFQNYPNPFNMSTIFHFQIPEYSFVSAKIYNILGEEIDTFVNEYKQIGDYKIKYDAQNQSNGIYFFKLKAGNRQDVIKFLILK